MLLHDSQFPQPRPRRTRLEAFGMGVLTFLPSFAVLAGVVNLMVPTEGLPAHSQYLVGGGLWLSSLAAAAVETWVYWPRDRSP